MSNKMNFHDRIKSGEFETKIQEPARLQEPYLNKWATNRDKKAHPKKLAAYQAALPAYEAAMNAYMEDQERIDAIFKAEAIIDVFGDDAKRFSSTIEKLWELAKKISVIDGSQSMTEVYDNLVDLSSMIEAIKKDLER